MTLKFNELPKYQRGPIASLKSQLELYYMVGSNHLIMYNFNLDIIIYTMNKNKN